MDAGADRRLLTIASCYIAYCNSMAQSAAPDVIALTVLALLTEQPRHPYEIQRLMVERHKEFALHKTRRFYHAVARLQRLGLIEAVETARDGRRPEHTVYQITAAGRDDFESRLCDLLGRPATEYPLFTVAVSFLACVEPGVALRALQGRAVTLMGDIAGRAAALRSLQAEMHLPRLFLIEVEYTQALREAELRWVRGLLEDMVSGRLAWDTEGAWVGRHFAAHDAPRTAGPPRMADDTVDPPPPKER